MPRSLAACHECRSPLPDTSLSTGALVAYPECGTQQQTELFPAFFRSTKSGSAGETIVVEGEAGCFFHPDKKAAAHCVECGRFLCALCDLELNGRHLCPGCLESGQRKGRLLELERRRTLYDSAALFFASLPLLVWPGTLITAPAALGLVFYGWNKPGSLIPRTRWRFVLAFVLALAQVIGWCVLGYFIVLEWNKEGGGG